MILTVTLNPALDITYHVDALTPGATHRVSRVSERLGGKGVNVAGVLAQLGIPVTATGLLRDGPPTFSPIAAAPRRTVVVTDAVDATGFWEPGPVVTPEEWAAFTVSFARLAKEAKVVVLSGSLPGGLPEHAYASLIGLARDARCLTILDTSGPALAAGLMAAPTVVKPNATELADLLTAHDATESGATSKAAPKGIPEGTTIVASDGPHGLTAAGWRAKPPVVQGNPTGAGDACVAALARGLLHGTPWPQLLRDAAALSAAAVASPVAGHVDLTVYQELLPQIVMEES
ncbi:1-phosphofructokinase family hexose kinase [Catelliglobosispora koreensis]|uniref:1-phosphofructokinase family hexose kinase n=1 Tax=Catelliglobosispora koreensis TaxID=129052 RepID=UPI00035F2A35|nr:PfkB family carbohydrate kinase [Catelliglobosispora koreensis]